MSTGANRGRHCLPFPMLVQPDHTVECRSRIPCPKKGLACGATDHRAVGSVDRFVVTSSTVIPGLLLVVVVGMAWGFSRRLRKRSQWSAAIDIQLGLFIEHTSLGSKRARGEGNLCRALERNPDSQALVGRFEGADERSVVRFVLEERQADRGG